MRERSPSCGGRSREIARDHCLLHANSKASHFLWYLTREHMHAVPSVLSLGYLLCRSFSFECGGLILCELLNRRGSMGVWWNSPWCNLLCEVLVHTSLITLDVPQLLLS